MSCMICLHCERLTDCDEDLDGTWLSSGYICTDCTDHMAADAEERAREKEEA